MELFSPHLHTLYKECLRTNYFPQSFYEANFVLLSKPDKDPLQCASYRSIALLNTDLKILMKMLAWRLTKVLHYLVSIDQTGFMASSSAAHGLWQSIPAIDLIII